MAARGAGGQRPDDRARHPEGGAGVGCRGAPPPRRPARDRERTHEPFLSPRVKISQIRVERREIELDPPFEAAWDPNPRRSFEATLVLVETDEGLTGIGSGDTMEGFERHEHHFVGRSALDLAYHQATLESLSRQGRRYWPLEAALWDLAGKAEDMPVAEVLGGAPTQLAAYA